MTEVVEIVHGTSFPSVLNRLRELEDNVPEKLLTSEAKERERLSLDMSNFKARTTCFLVWTLNLGQALLR